MGREASPIKLVFEGVRDARALTASWRDEYNPQRPHSSLGYLTAAGFAAACGEAPCS
jgi:transposase InsO family protein